MVHPTWHACQSLPALTTETMESWLKRSSNVADNREEREPKEAEPEPAKFRQYSEECFNRI